MEIPNLERHLKNRIFSNKGFLIKVEKVITGSLHAIHTKDSHIAFEDQ